MTGVARNINHTIYISKLLVYSICINAFDGGWLDIPVKEKKNRPFNVRLEDELATAVQQLSHQSKLTVGEIIRLCVDRELAAAETLKRLSWKKKSRQFNLLFADGQVRKLLELSRHTGLSQAELVRQCLARQLKKIRRHGGIKIHIKLDD